MTEEGKYEAAVAAESERFSIANSVDAYAEKYGVKTLFADVRSPSSSPTISSLIVFLFSSVYDRTDEKTAK
jgi:hypothetical protein